MKEDEELEKRVEEERQKRRRERELEKQVGAVVCARA